MKTIILLFLFIGLLFVIHGIYEQKMTFIRDNTRVEYRFIPRTYYEEQLNKNPTVLSNFKNMFQNDLWIDRHVTLSNPSKK
jgi:hypothetical protein